MNKTALWLVVVAALTFAASTAAFGQAAINGAMPRGEAVLEAAMPTAMGTIDKFDPQRRTLTLDNGDTYVLAANAAGEETLTPGQMVTLTYKLDGEQKIVQRVQAAPGVPVPEADAPNMPQPAIERLDNPAN